MKTIVLALATAAGIFANIPSVEATVVHTSAVGSTQYAFPAVDDFTSGPVAVTSNITWASNNKFGQATALYGWALGYSFGANGFWTGQPPMVALNSGSDVTGRVTSMTFSFANPVAGTGGLINWLKSNAPVTIEIYDSSLVLLESLLLSSLDKNHETPGTFFGFQRPTSDISHFVLRDGYIALRDFESTATPLSISPIPIPATLPLLAASIVAASGIRRYRNRRMQRILGKN